MKRLTTYILVFSCSLLISAPLYAQPMQGQGPGYGKQRLIRALELSEEQVKQLSEVRKPGAGREVMEAWGRERKKLGELVRNRNISDEAVRTQLVKLNEAQAALNAFRVEKILTIREILTEEQFVKLSRLRHAMKQRYGQGHGQGRGQGFGGQRGQQQGQGPGQGWGRQHGWGQQQGGPGFGGGQGPGFQGRHGSGGGQGFGFLDDFAPLM